MHLFDAPQPGSGKTLLADVVSMPVRGTELAANSEIRNGDDLRKWVTAMALAGENQILIDNVNARLSGSALAAALTKIEWSDRIIGTSRQARASMRCLWLATGNNVLMSSELARRVVRSRIDSGVECPNRRHGFRHANLLAWVKANRPSLIWAALTLVRHWVACGRPEGEIVLGSYESYCLIIGGILQAAGIDGFLADAGAHHVDDESIEWAAFVDAWRRCFESQRVGAADLDEKVLMAHPEMLATALGGGDTRADAGSSWARNCASGAMPSLPSTESTSVTAWTVMGAGVIGSSPGQARSRRFGVDSGSRRTQHSPKYCRFLRQNT